MKRILMVVGQALDMKGVAKQNRVGLNPVQG
jgi:hypothetical protein